MALIGDLIGFAWRKWVTPNVPSSGENNPRKADILPIGPAIDAAISTMIAALVLGNAVGKQTRANLYADLAHDADKFGIVVNDGTPEYNGLYIKSGASGTGSWAITANVLLPASFASIFAALIADKQDGAPNLDALAGLTSAANKLAYFTGSGAAALTDLSSFARTLLDDANATGALTTLGLTAVARSIAVAADAAAIRAILDLEPGTDVQAINANLTALAGLTFAANKILYLNGAGNLATADVTAAGRALLDDADATAQRTTLGLGPLALLASINTANITDGAVTNAKAATMATARLKGRVTAGTGVQEDLTAAQVRALLNVEDGATADMTGSEIKAAYEGQADTNAFTDTEKTKLAGVEAAADVTDAGNVGSAVHGAAAKATPVDTDTFAGIDSAASNVLKKFTWANIKAAMKAHLDTVYQPIATVLTNTTASFTTTLKDKLDSVAANATSNSSDAALRARASHTGTQAISTVDGLEDALNEKAAGTDLTAAVDRLVVQEVTSESLASSVLRPGDAPDLFTSQLTGRSSSRTPIAIGSRYQSDVYGTVLRINGADIPEDPGYIDVYTRYEIPLGSADKYAVRWAVERITPTGDPLGDGVELRIQNLNKNLNAVSNIRFGGPEVDGHIVSGGDAYPLPDALDAVDETIVISRTAGDDVHYVVPATTRYASIGVRLFKSTGDTGIAELSAENITLAKTVAGDAAAVASDLADEVEARGAADSALDGRVTAVETGKQAASVNLDGWSALAPSSKQNTSERGQANGYAPLGADSKVPEANQSGIATRAGAGDAGKTMKTNPTGYGDASFLDPMPTLDQIMRRGGSIAAQDPLPIQSGNTGWYIPVTAGVSSIGQVTLDDGNMRMCLFLTNVTLVVGSGDNSLRGDQFTENVNVRSGDLVMFQGEGSGVVRFRVWPGQRSVLQSAGASSAGSTPRLDADGKTDFSTQPKQYRRRTGGRLVPLLSWGGKGLGLFALYADGTIKNPMLNAMRRATAPLKTRTKPGGLMWAVGGKGKALLGMRDDGELVNKTISRIEAQAKAAQVCIDVWSDGDSRADLGLNPGRTTALGWQWWTQMASGGRVRFQDRNFGLGGDNSQQILDSAGSLWGVKPGWVVCFISINDPPEGNGAAWSLERIIAYRDRVLKMGHKVVFVAETPKGDGNAAGTYYAGFVGSQLRHHLSDRAVLLQQAAIAGCYIIDPWLDFIDPLSANCKAKDGLLREGLHFGPPGARLVGLRLAAFFNQMVPPRSFLPTTVADLYHSEYVQGSLHLNPLFQTLGGTGVAGANCTGTVADGWDAVAGSGLTGACSVGAAASGFGNHQQIVVGGTGPTSVETTDTAGNLDPRPISVVLQQTIMDTTLGVPLNPGYVVEGDSFQAMCYLEADAGIADVRGCGLYAWYTTAAGTFITAAGEPGVTRPAGQINLGLPNVAFSGPMITPETKPIVGAPTKAGVFWALTGVKYASGVAIPASGTFRISQCKTQKVIHGNPL